MSNDDKAMMRILEYLEECWQHDVSISIGIAAIYEDLAKQYPETKPLLLRLGKIKDE